MAGLGTKRLTKELAKITCGLPPGISLVSAENLEEWLLDIQVLDKNPIYAGQTYRLKFRFSDKYPIGRCTRSAMQQRAWQKNKRGKKLEEDKGEEKKQTKKLTWNGTTRVEPPEVTFVKLDSRPIPMHPHIYSNGIICLDLLGNQGWSPVQNVESVCMSIQSMLTGNTKNERPPGDEEFVRGNRLRPRDINFYYHDNTV